MRYVLSKLFILQSRSALQEFIDNKADEERAVFQMVAEVQTGKLLIILASGLGPLNIMQFILAYWLQLMYCNKVTNCFRCIYFYI